MQNGIYTGFVTHERSYPKKSAFTYKVGYCCLDVDNLPDLLSEVGVQHEKNGLMSFYRKNYLPNPTKTLKQMISEKLSEAGEKDWKGKTFIVTQLSHFGYCYNPVSFYYCYGLEATKPSYIIAEIHNTPWSERYCYIISCKDLQSPYHFHKEKRFHISPFLPMDLSYQWQFSDIEDKISILMDSYKEDKKIFGVRFFLNQFPLTKETMKQYFFSDPFRTHRTHARIYWQACKLWLQKTPFYAHPKTQG